VIARRGFDMRATFEQWQRSTPNEIDLETEQVVVRSRLRHHCVSLRADAEQPRHKAAHVRCHVNEQIGARDGTERRWRQMVSLPLRPQFGVAAADLRAKEFVQRVQACRLMEISECETGNTKRIMRADCGTHETPTVHGAASTSQTSVQILREIKENAFSVALTSLISL
jgi:hypothetical protein